jgi:hypothetical protein
MEKSTMRIDVAAPDAWGRLSERYRAHLPEALQHPGLAVLVFKGVGHAVTEVTKSLAQLYAHKKTIAIITHTDPSFESVAVAFSQDEFQVKLITPEQAKEAATWIPLLDELLFVLASEDDPITGKLTDLEALNQAITGKRVFKILVSHEVHNWKTVSRPEPFGIKILSLGSDRALLIGGERCKIQPQFAPNLYWVSESDAEIKNHLATLNASLDEASAKTRVEKFEANLPHGFKTYFKAGANRVFDRAVFFHPEFDGLAVIEELSGTLQTQVAPIGQESALETTSACRWQSPRFQDWLIARGETDESTRGLVIASQDLIEKGLATHLETAARKIERLQNGT